MTYVKILMKFFYTQFIKLYCNLRYCVFSDNEVSIKGLLWNCRIDIKGRGNKISIDSGVDMKNVWIEVKGNGHVICLLKNVKFVRGGRLRMNGNGNKLLLGRDTSFIDTFFSLGDDDSKIIIGDGTRVSSNVIFRNFDDHSIVELDDRNYRINGAKDIILGEHIWIGYGVTILKGVELGDDCVVGTRSLLTKSFPKNSLVAGFPAKVIRSGISWDRKWLPKKLV